MSLGMGSGEWVALMAGAAALLVAVSNGAAVVIEALRERHAGDAGTGDESLRTRP